MPAVDMNANSVYEKFNTSQLKELALAAGLPSETVNRLRSKEALTRAIDSLSDRDRLALLSHRVEAISPYKHCVLLEVENSFTYKGTCEALTKSFATIIDSFQPLQSDARDLCPQLFINDVAAERFFIKFAHMVDVWETTPSPDDQQVKSKVRKRHIMVAEINSRTQLVSIHFPGFTQVVVGKERVTYSLFAQEAVQILESKTGLKLIPFRLKPVTDILLDDIDEGVVDLRRTLRFKRGGKMDLDSESDEDAASTLAQGLANTGVKISAEAIRLAFRSSEAQSVVLLWQKQQIITRASMRNSLPEILFIWNEVEPSQSIIDDILGRLSWARSYLVSDGMKKARDYVNQAQAGELLCPFWLEQQFAIT